ncbi:phenazine biosynthesis FMN-dependent oxidase PhzG [Streptomyces sp. NPDC127033]|uniref:phenazine biosynthesis FMN-dependent oxidase PhzG n=1 Tax=Streptomyces sp. NPDC127033 TaxID=3347110 RepID=UPI003646B1FB
MNVRSAPPSPIPAEPAEFRSPPPEPLPLLSTWLDASRDKVREPGAFALATTGADGRSSNRIVQLNSLTAEGLVFTSHRDSRKGRDLSVVPWASAVFYWREVGRQILVAGPVERMTGDESDALWAARPVATHAMSVASHQSDPLDDAGVLRAEARRLAELGPLPRPESFVGYRLTARTTEFWESSPDRLHRRLRYDLEGGTWSARRLQP